MTHTYTNTIHDALAALEVFACDGAVDDLAVLLLEARERSEECDREGRETLARLFAIVEGAAGSYRLAFDLRSSGNVHRAMQLEASAGQAEAQAKALLLHTV